MPKTRWSVKGCATNRCHKSGWYLSQLQQFWLDVVSSFAAIFECSEAGDLTPEKVVSSALCLIGNAHRHMVQEMCKKLLLKLNPSLKFMADENSICSSHAVWGRVLLNRLPPQWTSLRPLGNVKLFWLPTLKLPSRWIQADFYSMQIVLYKCCYLL